MGSAGAEIRAALAERGLSAVLAEAAQAGPAAEASLLQDLDRLDWRTLDRQLAALTRSIPGQTEAGSLAPPLLAPPSTQPSAATAEAATAGWEALRAGRVALCTVAGGQASRLGFDGPKGAYPLGPVSGASLFQQLAGQVGRLRWRSGARLPWIIQTGPDNHDATQAYFARRSWFGLGRASLSFVCQGTLPALSPDGQLLQAAPGRLFRNPDGHGGFYQALAGAGLFDRLRSDGVDLLFYCQVDNPLARLGDPAFLGHHLQAGAEMSIKVVEKREPDEKVGLVVLRQGRACIIEYSDLSAELARQRDSDGRLEFRAGNIAIHAFDLAFAERMASAELELHLARKKVPALASGGGPVERDGVKFETFVFDALPLARRVLVQTCEREEEFSPVKNRAGGDSVATSRAALDRRARRWCVAAGVEVPPDGLVELAPGLALDQADFASRRQELVGHARRHLLAAP